MQKHNHVIFLSGSINSGKSTVAKILATRMKNSAVVEIDILRGMINWMSLDESISFNLKNASSVIKNFLEEGLDVIVPYPLSQKNYDFMLNGLKEVGAEILVFTLAPKLDKVLTNRGTRELGDGEVERIKYHYSIGIHSPSFGEKIDNTNQTPEETADQIFSKIAKIKKILT